MPRRPQPGHRFVSRDMKFERLNPDSRFENYCSLDHFLRCVTSSSMTRCGLIILAGRVRNC